MSAQPGTPFNNPLNCLTEYAVEWLRYDCRFNSQWEATKWRYLRPEDAEWMAKYQELIKGRITRVVRVVKHFP